MSYYSLGVVFMTDAEGEVVFKIMENHLVIEINRPEKNNVLNNEVRGQMIEFLKKYENDSKIKCVIFTSNGKNFSAGADIKNLMSLNEETVKEYTGFVKSFLQYIQDYPKVTIGAVHGIAVGGGLELLLALDMVLAADDARFGQTELNVGLIPGGGGTQRLPKIVGARKAREMIYTGRLINAEEAYQYGLINRIVPVENLMEQAEKLAAKVCEKSSISIALAKRALNMQWAPLSEAFNLESNLYSNILLSKDGREGMSAFLNKRKPDYGQ